MEKIKIIYIITNLNFGGAEKLLLDIVRYLDKSRYEVKVLTVMGDGPLVLDFEKAGVAVKIFEKKNKLGIGVIWRIYKYLKQEKPQIVHTHLFGGDTWGRLAAILARVPIIISTEHNTNLDEGFLKRLVKKILSFFTKKIIAVSQAVKNYSVVVDHINEKKMIVIPNGIEIDKFMMIPEKEYSRPPVIGIIGRLEKQKGHEFLFEALNLIKNIPWALWVVGQGSLGPRLEKLAKDLDLRERIIFLGARRNIRELLGQIDIFVLPSLWEGLGLAVLEAAAAGKPIVASRVGGVPEIIEDGKTGILVEPKNIKSLAEGLERVLLREGEAREMGRRAKKEIVKFDVKNMIVAYEKLYERLITNRK
jgi:glycosyltransferase involved in cell wall biosynthesis